MKKVLLIGVGLLVLVGGIVYLVIRIKTPPGQAVLRVNANSTATVFLDNQNLGKTPYNDKVSPGEYTLKLVPETSVETLAAWEGKIKLNPNLLTYVNRDFGESEISSAGETLTLEKFVGKKTEISVISTPDGSTIKLNDIEKGVTPFIIQNVEAGNYDLIVLANGFRPRTAKIKTTSGYRLIADFQLAALKEASAAASPLIAPSGNPKVSAKPVAEATPKASPKSSPTTASSVQPKAKATPPAKPYVEVLDTPTGFLNVRKEPSTSGEILLKVKPGEFYILLDEQTVSGSVWYKIVYEVDKEGWVSGQYAKKVE